jgi:hypothetical protein
MMDTVFVVDQVKVGSQSKKRWNSKISPSIKVIVPLRGLWGVVGGPDGIWGHLGSRGAWVIMTSFFKYCTSTLVHILGPRGGSSQGHRPQ